MRCEHPRVRSGGAGVGCGRRRLEVAAAQCWSCPPWSGAGGAGGAPRPPQAMAGGGPERNPGLGVGRRLWGQGQEAGAGCRQLAQLAVRVAVQSLVLAGRPLPQRLRRPWPWRGLSGPSPIHGLRLWERGAIPAPGRHCLLPVSSPGWSASSAGNSR